MVGAHISVHRLFAHVKMNVWTKTTSKYSQLTDRMHSEHFGYFFIGFLGSMTWNPYLPRQAALQVRERLHPWKIQFSNLHIQMTFFHFAFEMEGYSPAVLPQYAGMAADSLIFQRTTKFHEPMLNNFDILLWIVTSQNINWSFPELSIRVQVQRNITFSGCEGSMVYFLMFQSMMPIVFMAILC